MLILRNKKYSEALALQCGNSYYDYDIKSYYHEDKHWREKVQVQPWLGSGFISSHGWAPGPYLLWRLTRIVEGSSAAVFC